MRLNRSGSGISVLWSRIAPAAAVLLGAGASLLVLGSGTPSTGKWTAAQPPLLGKSVAQVPASGQALETYAGLPMIFEPNRGQSDSRVKFLARGSGYGLFLMANEAVLLFQQSKPKSSREVEVSGSVVRMKLSQSKAGVRVEGVDLLPGRSNYLIGNDPAKWHRGIPQYAKVRYREVYPGIDLIYYGKQGELEYDFRVQPGADPRQVRLSFEGAQGLEFNPQGDLLIRTRQGAMRLEAPQVYQTVDDRRKNVSGRFRILASDTVGFAIGPYDRSRSLIIDPVLSYSIYVGGSRTESFPTVAVDTAFNFYVTGATTSADFPVSSSPLQGTLKGAQNVFVVKFSPGAGLSAQPTVVYATYLGGSGTDSSVGIGVDAGFNAYVAGTTSSGDFPVSGTPLQSTPKVAGTHAFVSELDSTGSKLPYSTYLSGSGTDTASGMALDNKGLVYVIGITNSTDFPVAPNPGAYQVALVGPVGFFVSQINPANSGTNSLLYSTYFGGGFPATATVTGGAIAVDNNPAGSNIYITGGTNFQNTVTNSATDFPITNAFQPCLDGTGPFQGSCDLTQTALDAFVAKIAPPYLTTNNQGNQLRYSTYLGGTKDDIGYAIAVDAAGNAYVGGSTLSNDFSYSPVIQPYQKQNNGGMDGFVAKISNPQAGGTSNLIGLTYFSYLGGSGTDFVRAIAVDPIQGARVTGTTNSTDFPVAPNPGALQPTLAGASDAFVARLDTTATVNSTPGGIFATYLGGSGIDKGTGIAIDNNGSTYVTGETQSPDFNGHLNSLKGTQNAFVGKLGPNLSLAVLGCANFTASTTNPCPTAPPNVSAGNQVAFIYSITNTGDATAGVAFVDNLSSSGVTSNFVSATATGGSCPTIPTNNQLICSIGTINGGQTATVTVNLTPTTGPGNIGNSGQVIVAGSPFSQTASASALVNTFIIESISPPSFTVTAGQPATYVVKVKPQTVFTASVALSCSQGLPAGSTVSCVFSLNPILLPNVSSQSLTLTINTTARTTTIVKLRRLGPLYAALVPVGGLVFLGLGLGRFSPRKRRLLVILGILLATGLACLQVACSGSSNSNNTVGTPAGTYTVQVTATSGSYSLTMPVTLIVQ
ncbi:MAG TPA: SBBP repeat-containing protein [Terriglobales bacterium]|nr:SBBP repeat-containing protein [Terriglobales bacterium]